MATMEEYYIDCGESPADLLQCDWYEWMDKPDYTKLLIRILTSSRAEETTMQQKEDIRMCLIGDSHSRELVLHGIHLGLKHVKFIYI